MGNSQAAEAASSSSSSCSSSSTGEEWKTLKRTPFLPVNLFPTEVTEANSKRLFYQLPCSAKDFWDYAFTKECDSQASKIGKGVPISPVVEETVRAELLEFEVEGQRQIFTQRRFTIQPIPEEHREALAYYAKGNTGEGEYGVKMTVYQSKGHAGYMEFCVGFDKPWSNHIKIAGYAIVSDTPGGEHPAIMYVTLSVVVDFHSDYQANCVGSLWLSRREQSIIQYIYERLEARFEQTVSLFELISQNEVVLNV